MAEDQSPTGDLEGYLQDLELLVAECAVTGATPWIWLNRKLNTGDGLATRTAASRVQFLSESDRERAAGYLGTGLLAQGDTTARLGAIALAFELEEKVQVRVL